MTRDELLRTLPGEIERATGRRYAIDLEPLDLRSLLDLQRLVRDLDADKRRAVARARREPWRG